MSHRSVAAWACLALVPLAPLAAAQDDPLDPLAGICAEDFLAHIQWLADDAREGRLTGAPGERASTGYVAEHFQAWGLKPLGDNGTWFQEFPVGKRPVLGEGNACAITGPAGAAALRVEADFLPVPTAPSVTVDAPLVFAGYGTDTEGWNDWSGLDVKGKVVVALRLSGKTKPPGVKLQVPGMFGGAMLHQRQVKAAAERGAAALLLVSGAGDADDIGVLTVTRRTDEIPVLRVRRAALAPLLLAAGCDLAKWEADGTAGAAPARPAVNAAVRLTTALESKAFTGRNVIGFLEGSDPGRRAEAVVIGAHADHVGHNEASNATDANNEIHNGADDNASGTAGMLELAQAFATCAYRPARSVIFMSFTGEELGLLGSNFWCRHPTWPLKQVVGMINLDMIGRSKDGKCDAEATDSGEGMADLVKAHNASVGLSLTFPHGVRGDSDHASFAAGGVPVVFFFTGMHPQYHKSTDDWPLINAPDGARTTRLAFLVAADLAGREGRLAYKKSAMPGLGRPMQVPGVRLGFTPASYDDTGEGVPVGSVVPDGAGGRAGLLEGDLIVRIGDRKIARMMDLMEAFVAQKPGGTAECEVKRGKETKVLSVTWDAAAPGPAPGAVPPAAAPARGVRMGVQLGEDDDGATLDAVIDDTPAARAGLTDGDVVVRIGEKKITGGDDLRAALSALLPGSSVEVEVRRGKEKKVVTVKFE